MIYDWNWRLQSYSIHYPKSGFDLEKPANFEEMLMLAEKLAIDFNLIRIDLYSDGAKCFLGEITNCSGNVPEDHSAFTSLRSG